MLRSVWNPMTFNLSKRISHVRPSKYLHLFTTESNTNFVEHRHFLSSFFLVNPFILPYWFYSIRWELIDVFSIIVYFPSTFCPNLGHHQGKIYYKSDVTFVFALLLCKKKSVCTWDINNYGKYINQFLPKTIKSIRQYERINKKICRQKMSIMFNKICINEVMLPKYTYFNWI